MEAETAQRIDTIVAGAGPAGLAVAACLKRQSCPFLILEKSDKVGASWHNHYTRLHLHTDKHHSELPYLSYPDDVPTYPSRRQFIQYIDDYARHFNIRPRFNEEVISAELTENQWEIRTKRSRYYSQYLVVATGFNNKPKIPAWPGKKTFPGTILHSSLYRDGRQFRNKKVLVVGFGNSAGEIALDLHEHGAEVALSVRGPVNVIPRDLLGLPILSVTLPLSILPAKLADLLTAPVQRIVFGDLSQYGLQKASDGPFTQIQKRQRIPLIDIGTVELIQNGSIAIYPGIKKIEKQHVFFEHKSREEFDAIILATGFIPATDTFLKGFSLNNLEQDNRRGLFFCGFRVTATGVLRGISIEAKQIATMIAKDSSWIY